MTLIECGAANSEADKYRATVLDQRWWSFQQINNARRAVREFDGCPIADEDVRAVIGEALLAPSSGNSQPYVIHWLRDPVLKAAGATACRDQRAARSASTLLVFVASSRYALETLSTFQVYVESTRELSEQSCEFHLRETRKRKRFLRIAPSPLWTPLHGVLTAVCPSFTLLPVGSVGIRHWAVRSTLFAAQTILLAAAARGLDSCPMEGFDPRQLGSVLGLKRGDLVALVIALGRRRPDARIESRWRRPVNAAVQVH